MAKIVRYGGNLKAFASEQLTNERTLFGQVTIANDLTSQVTAQFLRGWGTVGPSDQPSLQDFNAAMYTNGQLLAYLHQMGVAEYNAAQEYHSGSLTQTGGVLYISLTDTNIGNAPSSSPVNWKAFTADQATEVALGLVKIATQALTNAGADDATAVTPKKLSAAIQGQKHTAFTTTGTATAQVMTPAPAIAAYSPTQRFNVTFNVASGINPTINISGQGVKFIKQYDSAGAKVAAIFAANQNSDIVYDGVDFVLLDQLPSIADLLNTPRINIASAATVNLTSSAPSTRNIALTGTTGITGFTVAAGQLYFVTFLGALTLTNSASLITQSNANIVTAAGDTCILRATAANTVEILCYTPGIPQAIGYLQTTQVMGGARVVATDYTNTTGRPILLSVYAAPSASNVLNLLVNGVVVAQNTVNNAISGANSTLTWVILPGQVYRVNSSLVALATWAEIRL